MSSSQQASDAQAAAADAAAGKLSETVMHARLHVRARRLRMVRVRSVVLALLVFGACWPLVYEAGTVGMTKVPAARSAGQHLLVDRAAVGKGR